MAARVVPPVGSLPMSILRNNREIDHEHLCAYYPIGQNLKGVERPALAAALSNPDFTCDDMGPNLLTPSRQIRRLRRM